jgi:hypothetical protein
MLFFLVLHPIFLGGLEPPLGLFMNVLAGNKACLFFGLIILVRANNGLVFGKSKLL